MSEAMGGLPERWAWATLEDIAQWGSGGTPKADIDAYYGGDIPWAVIGDMRDRALYCTRQSITQGGFEASSAKWIPKGAVLVAMYGASIGKLAISGIPLTSNQAIAHAVPFKGGVSEKYLFWYLYGQRERLIGAGKGGAQPNISQNVLKRWEIPVPPLGEQRRIVEALEEQLSRLDAAKASAARSLQRIDTLGSTLLMTALAATSKVTTLKDSLSAPLINGRSVKTMENGFPVLRLTALKGGRIDLGEFKEGAWDADDAHPFLVEKDDFLISRGNGTLSLVGRGGLVGEVGSGVAFPDTMIRARVAPEVVVPEFLSLIWGTRAVRRQIEGSARTTAGIYKVNQKILESVEFPLPSLEQQLAIVRRREIELEQLAAVRNSAEHALRRARALEKALLRKAFSGGLVPQERSDEPASALLARIAAEREAAKPVRKAAKRAARSRKATAADPVATTKTAPVPTPSPSASVQQELFVQ
ncbi:restriction endonuclease subunit S [Streptomyces niveus]|uniref:restriction endonuclease subunit S n=1 Tax=Streptomyces niveus TaxID=193462 RepID=UPI0038693EF9